MKTKSNRLTLDEVLSPSAMTCARCGGVVIVYPYPNPIGTGYCPACSPAWVKSFATWGMNQERQKYGLEACE